MSGDALTTVHEIATLLQSIKDEGTEVDTGAGMGGADLWISVGGIEWFITVRKSNNQRAKETT